MATKAAKAEWRVESEVLDLGDGRWGVTSFTGGDGGSPWEWQAEGGELGPVEGVARNAAQARARVEQVLGLRPAPRAVERLARQYQRQLGGAAR